VLGQLLDGSARDTSSTLSSLTDQDLPLALAVTEALKFKALHGESKLSSEDVRAFRAAVEKRIAESKLVSLVKNETCHLAVPAAEINYYGVNLTVPAYFTSDGALRILDFAPKNEAGSLLPDVSVSFTTDKPPVKAEMKLDGVPVKPSLFNDNTFIYRPALAETSILAIGTHSVELVLTDSSARHESKSWLFTVGVTPASTLRIPDDAKITASFSVDLSRVVSDPRPNRTLTLVIRETPDGKRFVEYVVSRSDNPNRPVLTTQSLILVKKFISKSEKEQTINITPLTPYAFVGTTLNFSCTYEGYDVKKVVWKFYGHGEHSYEGQTISYIVPEDVYTYRCTLFVVFTHPDGTTTEGWVNSDQKWLTPIALDYRFNNFPVFGNLNENGTESFDLRIERSVFVRTEIQLVEGKVVDVDERGKLSVNKARWKVIGGTASPTFEDITATHTKLVFKSPGYVEIVQDIALSFDWDNEHYESAYKYTVSGLYGVFRFKAVPEFEEMPQGIIYGTDRKIKIKKIDFTIEKEKRTIIAPDPLSFDPPWVLARSELFPENPPMTARVVSCGFTLRTDKESALPQDNWYTYTLPYSGDTPVMNRDMYCRGFLYAFGYNYKVDKITDIVTRGWDDYTTWLVSITEWMPIKAYPSPAELVDVKIEPEEPLTIREGQKLEFESSIVPKPGLGTGKLDSQGGEMDLLNGYEVTGLEKITWEAILAGEVKSIGDNPWSFTFDPGLGTGTYQIKTDASLNVKEKNTGGVAKACGKGQVNVLVKPGLRIKSPRNEFAYPVGTTVRLTTSLDGTDEGKNLKWYLNGTEWTPEGDPGAYLLFLDKAAHWSLTAELKTTDQNGQEVLLSHTINFESKPVSVSITPARKVILFNSKKTPVIPLKLNVNLGEEAVDEPNKNVPWITDQLVARVEKADWKFFTDPTDCAKLHIDQNNSFNADAEFLAQGAATALATITVVVNSTSANPHQASETFVIPFSRADLWALSISCNDVSGHFPNLSLAQANRTFIATETKFLIGKTPYSWTPDEISPKLSLPPAIPGISNLVGEKLLFNWKAANDQSSTENKFIVSFIKPSSEVINLGIEIDFGTAGSLQIFKNDFPITINSVEEYISVQVDPSSFSIPLGHSQLLTFEIIPKKKRENEGIYICNHAFNVSPQEVAWSKIGESLGIGNPYNFTAKENATGTITGKGTVFFEETFSPPAPGGTTEMSANTEFSVETPITRIAIQRLDPPLYSDYFETGFRKVETRFRAVAFSGDDEIGPISVNWELEGGVATTPLRIEILKKVTNGSSSIAVIDGSDSVPQAEEVTLTSFLPGSVTLWAREKRFSASVLIRIKQPTLYLSIKGVVGANLTQLRDWAEEAKKIWAQGKENFLIVKIKHGEFDNESFPWVGNETFTAEPWPSSEYLFASVTNGLSLLEPLVLDVNVIADNNNHWTIPRLSRELMNKKRSATLPDGTERDINVYVVKQAYDSTFSIPFPTFNQVAGYSISRDEFFEAGGSIRINDFASSGIILSSDAILCFKDRYQRTLAHEMGHHLIQIGGNEHVDDAENIMNSGDLKGTKINASQAILILDYEKSKPSTSYFLSEE